MSKFDSCLWQIFLLIFTKKFAFELSAMVNPIIVPNQSIIITFGEYFSIQKVQIVGEKVISRFNVMSPTHGVPEQYLACARGCMKFYTSFRQLAAITYTVTFVFETSNVNSLLLCARKMNGVYTFVSAIHIALEP